MGGLIESSRELMAAYRPQLLLFGTAGYYSALWHTDGELLLALRNLSIPVMIVPQHIVFRPLERVGFACDYRNEYLPDQTGFVRQLLQETGAHLQVVHVTHGKPGNNLTKQNEAVLRHALQDVQPSYFSIESPDVFKAVDAFVREQKLDMLIVIPRKQEFWYSLFNKSNMDQLAFLNRLPIVALPQG